ncbi:dihydrofolate reductase family protein [Cellulomonas sp.]|uniref:dihydrofolate reductase family protein n=1 Tax=Cellulomonas sp. TaxID=40001 RepID=UPI001B053204|nr:dihydrofolate reductase family protein [Cellulomonas sp.]MBO9556560.1 dihydrofolate reductase family protein [Cellulomonas sp.]
MARLLYTAITSLDGYVADPDGRFDWAAPDEEVHAAVNELERPVGTYLYGRRMYRVMAYWESAPDDAPPVQRDYAQIWRAADKVVYSSTLDAPVTSRTRIERSFDPAAVAVLKASSERDLSLGGPGLAAHALRAGLVDELQLLVTPVVVGGGTPFLPDDVRLDLELLDQRRFGNGAVLLRYDVRSAAAEAAA